MEKNWRLICFEGQNVLSPSDLDFIYLNEWMYFLHLAHCADTAKRALWIALCVNQFALRVNILCVCECLFYKVFVCEQSGLKQGEFIAILCHRWLGLHRQKPLTSYHELITKQDIYTLWIQILILVGCSPELWSEKARSYFHIYCAASVPDE